MTYYAVLESRNKDDYRATVMGLPNITATGKTRQEALSNLRQIFYHRLPQLEIVPLEEDKEGSSHPWKQWAGIFKDDPQFDEMVAEIEAYRRELDADDNGR